MKTYISGKITGLPLDVARSRFEKAEKLLKKQGTTPVNPMKLKPLNNQKTWKDYMASDIRALFDCKAIYMLDNWEESRGATIEHAIAQVMEIEISYE